MVTENFQLNIGSLRSQMSLTIHTRQASRLWQGRRPTEEKQGILGLSGFLSFANRINSGSRMGDPYSDWWMVRVEEKIELVKNQLERIALEVDAVFESVPTSFSVSENLNLQPATLPVFSNSQIGYLAIYVLAKYDEIVRKAILAHHIALIGRATLDHWLERGDSCLRSLFALVQRYKFSGTTRKDFMEENAASRAAIEKFGEVPKEVLDGTSRSKFSPTLRNDNQSNDSEEEQDIDIENIEVVLSGEAAQDEDEDISS